MPDNDSEHRTTIEPITGAQHTAPIQNSGGSAKRASRLASPWTLFLILILALGLRLIALGSRTLWYDEAFAVLFSEKGLSAMIYGTLTPVDGVAADVHPLLYYTTLDTWMGFVGQSPEVVRFYSVLTGVATVGMLYFLARELFDGRTATIAALIAAVAPFHVQYSQEARMYALLGLLLVTATWCFVRGWRTQQAAYWVGFGVLSGLSMYTQQLAGFYLVALGLVPFLVRRRDQIIRVVLSGGLAVLIYLPWLVNLPSQLGKVGNYWVARPTFVTPLVTLWSMIFVELPIPPSVTLFISLTTFVLVVVFLIIKAVPALRRATGDRSSLGLTLWLIAGPMGLMWLVSQWRPVYLTRALVPSALMLYIALAWLLTRTRLPRPILGLLVAVWGLSVALGLYAHYTWNTFPRPPFDQAYQAISGGWGDNDQVVHANKLTMLPMVYYDHLLNIEQDIRQSYVRDIPGSPEDTLALPTQDVLRLWASPCVAAAANGRPRVWFVIFKEQIEQQGGVSPDLAWMDAHYHRVRIETFNDLQVYLYDQPDAVARAAQCN